MKHCYLFSAGMILLALCACTRETFIGGPGEEVSAVQVIGPADIVFEEPATRGTEIINGSTLRFSWAMGDSLGIFPDKGNQVEFPITSTEGGTSAVFDGGGWGLKNGSSYAAYYPFSVWNYHRNNKKILLDYSGQVQDGNGSFAHLSAYDYLASSRETPANGQVTFEMSRLGAILYIDIVVPEPTVVNSLVISCDEEIFTEKADLDISGEEAAVTPKKMTNTLTLEFKNTTTTTANETVRGYMAVYPVDFSNKTVYATLKTEAGLFGAAVQSRVVNKGKAAFLRFSDSFISQSGEDNGHEYIEMAPGFYWATCNVGADNPWDYGDYFCWGETEPRSFASTALNDYKWRNSSGAYTKYVTDESSGTVDNLTTLLPADDAATTNWLGNWRMPTDAEWTTLRNPDNFTWEWTDNYNGTGMSGYTITSKVPRYIGNQIFLPAAGVGSGTFISKGSGGTYWSSSLNTGHSSTACNVDFWISESTGAQYIRNVDTRYFVKSVRPVYAPNPISIPEAIDLGLPSGLKWASFNLGASAPEEYGDYYAWGETEPYYSSQDPLTWKDGKKDGYSWLSYKWCKGSYKIVTKYCSDSSYGYNGFTDTKTVLDSEDDAASVNLGGNWRMPTYDEFTELKTNCTWEWMQVNGINGRKVTGPNGNSIFLPAAGDWFMWDFKYAGSVGTYWSSSLDAGIPYNAVDFGFNSDLVSWNNNQRYIGYSVRPVCE